MKKEIRYSTKFEKNIIDILDILICPKTGGKLKYDKKNQELISEKAMLAYPIKDNIPILLVKKARKLSNK